MTRIRYEKCNHLSLLYYIEPEYLLIPICLWRCYDVMKDCLNVSVLEVLRCSHPLARSQPSDCYCIQLKSLSICCCFSPVITEERLGDGEILSYTANQWRASYHQASCSSSIHMWPHSTSLLLFSRLFFVCFVHFHLVCSCIFSLSRAVTAVV